MEELIVGLVAVSIVAGWTLIGRRLLQVSRNSQYNWREIR